MDGCLLPLVRSTLVRSSSTWASARASFKALLIGSRVGAEAACIPSQNLTAQAARGNARSLATRQASFARSVGDSACALTARLPVRI
jgi:hypothetical protein